jgi:RPA family protein
VILRVFSADFSNPEISHSTKEKSTEKIDGATPMIMALDRAIRCGCVSDESIYDSREMLIL